MKSELDYAREITHSLRRFIVKVGRRGVIVLPKCIRELFRIEEGDTIHIEFLQTIKKRSQQ